MAKKRKPVRDTSTRLAEGYRLIAGADSSVYEEQRTRDGRPLGDLTNRYDEPFEPKEIPRALRVW